MFIEDAHILRASSSTVCAWTSKRPAIARIECGSVIKRVAMLAVSLLISDLFSVVLAKWPDGYALAHRRPDCREMVSPFRRPLATWRGTAERAWNPNCGVWVDGAVIAFRRTSAQPADPNTGADR